MSRNATRPASSAALRWAGVVALAPIAVFADALAGRRLLAPGDGYEYYLPLHRLVASAWRAGVLPVWNPYAFSGMPLLAITQAGVLYPPNLIHVLLPAWAANNVLVTLAFVVAGCGAYALARELVHDDAAAAIAGLAFGLCGFFFGHVGHHSMIASIAWLPWALLGVERARQRLSPSRVVVGAGAIALSLLAGHPQMFFVTVTVVVLYGSTLLVLDADRHRTAAATALVATTGIALCAVQLLPLASITLYTDRAALDYATASSYSFTPSNLVLLAFPYLFGNQQPTAPFDAPFTETGFMTELTAYPGAACLVLAGIGLIRGCRDSRALALLVCAAAALIAALGDSTPAGRLLFALPVAGAFRAWGRYAVVFDLAAAVLAAYGVALLRRRDVAPSRTLRAGAAVVAGLIVVALAARLASPVSGGRHAVLAVAVPLVAAWLGLLMATLLAVRRRTTLATVGLMLIVALDALGFGWFYEWREHSLPLTAALDRYEPGQPTAWGRVHDAPDGIDRYVFVGGDVSVLAGGVAQQTVAKRMRSLNGYDPLAPRDYLDVTGMAYTGAIYDGSPLWQGSLLDVLRVSTVLVQSDAEQPPWAGVRVNDRLLRYDRTPRLPDAYLVGDARIGDAAAGARLAHSGALALGRTAVVDGPCPRCAGLRAAGRSGDVTTVRGWSTITASVDAQRPSLLVLSEAWFPGWTATVDGTPAPVVRANAAVLGIPVPAGRHAVRVAYRPPGLAAGAAITGVAAVALVVWSWRLRPRSTRTPCTDP